MVIKIEKSSSKTFNKLINEKSPYLLQHASNPVDWYPWGTEAFTKARENNMPIFLSIGYSTCHWCHVMAHESFEDPEVAKSINDVFIPIKVDREERPDIDKIYMTVCQMMTGSGGWPLTIIMTPEKKPFFAGTYFPKETRFGRIGLLDLIKRIKDIWINKKGDLIDSAEQIIYALQNISQESPGDKLNEITLKNAYRQLKLQFDSKNGGFGSRPKFPMPHNLLFLLRFWKRTGSIEALEMVEKTLLAIRKGGIFDHIGYGIHRYSTDSNWLVPHFEKMLYDQALITMVFIEAYLATKKDIYIRAAQEIFTYILRDMTSPEGAFYSAEDADSEGEEGKFYVWSLHDIKNILEKDEAELAIEIFNITDTGNYLEEATRSRIGNNILYLKEDLLSLSKKLGIAEDTFKDKLEVIRKKLFRERLNRIPPHKDDKILTDWNGLMIAALAKGAQILSNPLYLEVAKKSVNFILSMLRKSDGRLLHSYRDNKAEIDGYLTDYAFLIWGLIELYEATFDVFYLKTALDLQKAQINDFWDENIGGFYFTAENSEKILTRQKDIYDGALPSGNSIAMLNLLRLSYLTGNHEFEQKADILSRVFTEKINQNPSAYSLLMVAVDFSIGPSYSVVIAGNHNSEDTIEMLNKIRYEYIPNKTLILRKTEQNPPKIDEYSNFIEYFNNLNGKATAYVCINKTCKQPTNNPDKLLEFLNSKWEKIEN
ncbi:MAG: thioredoxin domain-containing protein [Promethearchaeota archaeon]